MQGYLFASDVKMYTVICLGDVPLIQCIDRQAKTLQSISINPFTAPACNISGLKDVRTHLQTVHFPGVWHIYSQCHVF